MFVCLFYPFLVAFDVAELLNKFLIGKMNKWDQVLLKMIP